MRTADDFVGDPTSGNTTDIDIAAPPSVVWQALDQLRPRDLRVTPVLMGIRSLPALLLRRGSLRSSRATADRPLLESMRSSRFFELYRQPESILTLGIVGQFWKLDGGEDANVRTPQEFVAFDRSGFVVSAIDFQLQPHATGTRVTTRTCNRATDEATERRFRRYWLLIGAGSKAIRFDLLRAVRRRAEAAHHAAA